MRNAKIAYISTSAAEMMALPTASGRLASTEMPAVATLACLMAETHPPSAIGSAAQNNYMPCPTVSVTGLPDMMSSFTTAIRNAMTNP